MIPHKPTHPGELLRQELEAREIGFSVFAKKAGLTHRLLLDIIEGAQNIHEPVAKKLQAELGITADYWLRMQKQYDSDMEKKETVKFTVDLSAVQKKAKQIRKSAKKMYKTSKELTEHYNEFFEELSEMKAEVIEKEPTKPELKEGEFYYCWDEGYKLPCLNKFDGHRLDAINIEYSFPSNWKYIVPATEANLKKYFG